MGKTGHQTDQETHHRKFRACSLFRALKSRQFDDPQGDAARVLRRDQGDRPRP
ncbi:cbb3-type cytochrome oxidase assembly protein CcoS [Szabonella alba]|uniref:Cbb3-type cytochrome oxidase assembly protein CcoS n=1 Tax=Szabonella alba TaxID=2804194 RepID=A0A8K0V9W3_9RHOB|nr:cbb3-type cytochrome oxidase assembly protein CcoS [Szabonella alba]